MGKIYLRNIFLNGQLSDMFISNGVICSIMPAGGEVKEVGADVEVVDCEGKTAIPGFVNMHTHAAMSLMRGVGEDIAFHEWLDRIWRIEEKIDEEYVYHGTKVA